MIGPTNKLEPWAKEEFRFYVSTQKNNKHDN